MEKNRAFHLNNFKFLLPKDALHWVWWKLTLWLLRRVFWHFHYYSKPWNGLSHLQSWINFSKECSMLSFGQNVPVVLHLSLLRVWFAYSHLLLGRFSQCLHDVSDIPGYPIKLHLPIVNNMNTKWLKCLNFNANSCLYNIILFNIFSILQININFSTEKLSSIAMTKER